MGGKPGSLLPVHPRGEKGGKDGVVLFCNGKKLLQARVRNGISIEIKIGFE